MLNCIDKFLIAAHLSPLLDHSGNYLSRLFLSMTISCVMVFLVMANDKAKALHCLASPGAPCWAPVRALRYVSCQSAHRFLMTLHCRASEFAKTCPAIPLAANSSRTPFSRSFPWTAVDTGPVIALVHSTLIAPAFTC